MRADSKRGYRNVQNVIRLFYSNTLVIHGTKLSIHLTWKVQLYENPIKQ